MNKENRNERMNGKSIHHPQRATGAFWRKSCLTKWATSTGGAIAYIENHLFIVVDGEVRIISGDKEILAGKNQAVFVDGMIPHSIWNNGDQTATVIKISTKRPDSNGKNARRNELSLCDS